MSDLVGNVIAGAIGLGLELALKAAFNNQAAQSLDPACTECSRTGQTKCPHINQNIFLAKQLPQIKKPKLVGSYSLKKDPEEVFQKKI